MKSFENILEDLRKWFGTGKKGGAGGGGWDRYNTKGERIGKCAREPGEGKPKCLSKEKAAKMSKSERASAVRRKREKDPSVDRPGTGNKPIHVSNKIGESMRSFREYLNEKNKPTNPSLWSRIKGEAKRKFDVYPSAYANGWAAKKYKAAGGGWKSVKEEKQNCGCGQDPCITYGKQNESLDGGDKPTLKRIIKKLKGASSAHAGQAKDLEKAMKESAAWQRKEGKNKEGGLNAAGRRSYERENPGSDLKAPVSAKQAKKSKGGKAAKRRKSFCARMGGMPGAMKKPNGEPTRKALALRKWDC